jgi:hypothetical protein
MSIHRVMLKMVFSRRNLKHLHFLLQGCHILMFKIWSPFSAFCFQMLHITDRVLQNPNLSMIKHSPLSDVKCVMYIFILKTAIFWVVVLCRLVRVWVNSYQTTRCYNPEDSPLHSHCRGNLKSYLNLSCSDNSLTIVTYYKYCWQ